MATISRDELLRLARSGAVARVHELQAELDLIYATFPDLRTGAARGRAAKTSKVSAAAPAPKAAKTAKAGTASRAWSSAARKAVSERMKKYWAARRAKTAKASK